MRDKVTALADSGALMLYERIGNKDVPIDVKRPLCTLESTANGGLPCLVVKQVEIGDSALRSATLSKVGTPIAEQISRGGSVPYASFGLATIAEDEPLSLSSASAAPRVPAPTPPGRTSGRLHRSSDKPPPPASSANASTSLSASGRNRRNSDSDAAVLRTSGRSPAAAAAVDAAIAASPMRKQAVSDPLKHLASELMMKRGVLEENMRDIETQWRNKPKDKATLDVLTSLGLEIAELTERINTLMKAREQAREEQLDMVLEQARSIKMSGRMTDGRSPGTSHRSGKTRSSHKKKRSTSSKKNKE